MYISRRGVIGILVVLVALASLVLAVGAAGHDRKGREGGEGRDLFRSTLAPSMPTDPTLHGVAPGGLPWSLEEGSVRLRQGRFRLRVEGLVLTGMGNPGPVTTIKASLFCGNDTTPAAMTGTAKLSNNGDARIDEKMTLPSSCLAPVVLVHPNGIAAVFIAVSGFRP